MSKNDWKKLGYTDEESEELENLNGINANSVGDIDIETANITLEKENKIMSNNASLGKSLTETLREGVENFANWTSAMTTILNNRNELKNNLDAIKEFDSALTDLKKVSEETVKVAIEK